MPPKFVNVGCVHLKNRSVVTAMAHDLYAKSLCLRFLFNLPASVCRSFLFTQAHSHSWKMLWATYCKCQQQGNSALLLAVEQQLVKDWNCWFYMLKYTRSTVRAITKRFVSCPILAFVSKTFQSCFIWHLFFFKLDVFSLCSMNRKKFSL